MRGLKRLVVAGLILHCFAMLAQAADYEPVSASKPLVTLLPQIEELQSPADPAPSQKRISQNSSAGSSIKPRPLFPAARQFFRNLSSEPAAPASEPSPDGNKSASTSSIKPISGTDPEPTLYLPPVGAQGQSPPVELITPEMVGIVESVSPCDQPENGSVTGGVSPQSRKIGTRLRFPAISRMFAK